MNISTVFLRVVDRPAHTLLFLLALSVSLPSTAQTVVSTVSPARHAPASSRTGSVVLGFSQALTSGTETNVRVVGSLVRGGRSGAFTGGGSQTVSFDPAQDFAPGERVRVSVPATVRDASGATIRPHWYEFLAAAGPGSAVFSAAPSLAVPSDPSSMALGDVNNDGLVDMLVSHAASTSITVQLGNSQGSFASTFSVFLGVVPGKILLADFNHDGQLDLVTANTTDNSVSVRLGNGRGAFTGSANLAVGTAPVGLAVADVNTDGRLDVVVANSLSNHVSVALGNGAGGFTAAANVPAGANTTSIGAADVNNDGWVDLLTTHHTANTLTIQLGNGLGSFTAGNALPTQNQPGSVTAADLNADGQVDLLVGNRTSGTVSVYLGQGGGNFTTQPALSAGADLREVVAGDVNGDGVLDVLAAAASANAVTLHLGDGAGGFASGTSIAVDATPVALVAADLDGDTALDLAVVSAATAKVSVRLNQGPPIVAALAPLKALPGARIAITGRNFNNATQVAFAGLTATSFVVNSPTSITATVPAGAAPGPVTVTTPVASGNSPLPFRVQFPVSSVSPARHAPSAGRSGNIELTFPVVLAATAPANVRVFGSRQRGLLPGVYSGGGSSQLGFDPAADYAAGEEITVCVPATVTDAVGREARPQVFQFRAAAAPSTGTFTAAADVPTPSGTYHVVAGDVNNDGRQDLITGNIYNSTATVWLGNGQGGFTAGVNVVLTNGQTVGLAALVLADANNDGSLDLLSSSGLGNQIYVRLGNGQGGFTGSTSIVVSSAGGLSSADFNGDGNLDLITATGGGFAVLYGNGLGDFPTRTEHRDPDLFGRGRVECADVNNDGSLDVLIGNPSSNGVFSTVATFLGDGEGNFRRPSPFGTVVGGYPIQIVTADVNQDGFLDFLCAHYASTPGRLSLRLGDGTGNFQGSTEIAVGRNPEDLKFADVDGDGDLDFLCAHVGTDPVSIGRNDGQGTFTVTATSLVGTGKVMAPADFNGDGTIDFAEVDDNTGLVRVRLNGGRPLAAAAAITGAFGLFVYPNPVRQHERITIEIAALTPGEATVRVVDAVGRTLYHHPHILGTGRGRVHLPAGVFQGSGVYLLQVVNAQGIRSVRVLVVTD